MKRLLPLLLFSFAFSASAQNYELFPNPSDTLAFKGSNGDMILFMSFDSINTYSNQTIYWPHRESHISNVFGANQCMGYAIDSSWFGYNITRINNSYLFEQSVFKFQIDISNRNPNLDSVGWAYRGFDFHRLELLFKGSKYIQLFNGLQDSVLIYELVATDTASGVTSKFGKLLEVIISQNHGIISFPFLECDCFYSQVAMGSRNLSRTSFKALKRKEIFEFDLGDRFHYKLSNFSYGSNPYPNYGPPVYLNNTIIGKNYPNKDSVVYTIDQLKKTFKVDPYTQQVTEILTRDTLLKGYGELNRLISNELSFQSDTSHNGYHYSKMKTTFWLEDSIRNRNGVYTLSDYYYRDSNCIDLALEPSPTENTFLAGIGLFHQLVMNFPSAIELEMLYFKKANGQTWGTPYHIGMNELALKTQLKLYPNPSSDVLNIELPDGEQQLQVTIFDQLGRILIKQSIDSENYSIAVSALSPGTYFVKTGFGQAIPFVKQ